MWDGRTLKCRNGRVIKGKNKLEQHHEDGGVLNKKKQKKTQTVCLWIPMRERRKQTWLD